MKDAGASKKVACIAEGASLNSASNLPAGFELRGAWARFRGSRGPWRKTKPSGLVFGRTTITDNDLAQPPVLGMQNAEG